MMPTFEWGNEALTLSFEWTDGETASVAALRANGVDVRFGHRLPLTEILATGTGHWLANDRLAHTDIGRALRYVSHAATHDAHGDHLDVTLADTALGLTATVHYDLPAGTPMFRTSVTVANVGDPATPDAPALGGDGAIVLESVTSWVSAFGAPAGKAADCDAWTLLEGEHEWLGEGRWHATPTRDLFPRLNQQMTGHNPRSEHAVVNTGTWSTGKHTPLALLDSRELGLTWLFQIEHNAAWRWEVARDTEDGYIALSGPTNVDHAWAKRLAPGESFTTVPASVTVAADSDAATAAVTAYRRAMRIEKADNARPRVIFNDYMNTINGDPTTEKLLPLVKGAAEVGAEIFCIDAGWYDDTGDWWPSVGEWMPSRKRFPNGITEVIDAIRDAGMIAGLWLEPEVIGVKSPMAVKLPESAFFHRHGRRVVEQERYLLDLRDPAARKHLDDTVDRLVNDYGVGYFKFDYNVSPDAGTDTDADGAGDGLLGHNRAYGAWVEGLHARHPELIIENCSSGGMRMDFAQTSRFQVQSTSDQQDFRLYPTIAAAAPMLMTPEQAGNWAYPNANDDPEAFAFNLNTTFLGRFFLSGYVNRMSDAQRAMITQAVDAYKREVQPVIGGSVPFWPLGLPQWDDDVVALGLRVPAGGADAAASGDATASTGAAACGDATVDVDAPARKAFVTVWARDGKGGDVTLKLPEFAGAEAGSAAGTAGAAVTVEPLFPVPSAELPAWPERWNAADNTLTVTLPAGVYAARTFAVTAQ
ncbi:glycoside hydrolase family 36 protein [Bifidobacterium platyrrhinorum]|uniref:Alpha-galactosidase n=1 Tax=Bifidobacterium platyrrhinorum TaxID=2661628 RepID=A0A6L9SRR0_9BIFI|nr:glycoside hydrolase family 36 protein [Bifidobacterium platyrrhinorum]NEG54875.1 alpha-galactosidase [Bifidobacterium platyrrhinorum]